MEHLEEAWDAFHALHAELSNLLPPGSLPSPEEIDRRYGPKFSAWAQAIAEGVAKAMRCE